ncbi:uncharacterized protein N7496_012028 [Penicillium cataractarum]|uniref:Lysophospholipase n=1 Tax=Penicillium cataractarum TaxID=2100454 RepID=A0A9W9RG66_9EURO|nr:uncharacterized protein N7496_012028 [Penicillium cataractarum]KAJ5359615.1 hypothetical protein N7496_012028 [Penicillium cataractarum]
MKTTALLALGFLGTVPSVDAIPASVSGKQVSRALDIRPRALPNAPNGYAPAHVTCPSSRPTIRSASTLSSEETTWLKSRRQKTETALKDFFGHVEIDDFDAVSYIKKHSGNYSALPNIAIGISGGGLVACLNGGGTIKAFDERTEGSTAKGQLGGLLQSSTYFSALSGGSWALGSIYINNFTTVSNLQENLWNFTNEIVLGPSTMSPVDFWATISDQVKSKREAGFSTGDPDFWGRIQGYQFFNASDGGVDYTWSSIAETQAFQDGDMPLPLVVMTGNHRNTSTLGTSPKQYPIYETTPWEWGTYDDNIYGFTPLEYLGTQFIDGVVPSNDTCVRGFDNAGFITGTSSDIWNEYGQDLVYYFEAGMEGLSSNSTDAELFKYIIEEFLNATSSTNSTINGPAYYPNPFYKYNTATSPVADEVDLVVQDGGETSENIPLYPLIQRKRNVDVIFAVDSLGGDSDYDWPTGSALVATYNRTLLNVANDTSFPPVPDVDTFLKNGLNTRPTFFGCNASSLSTPAPLIVYLPNHDISFASNYSIHTENFTDAERDAVIMNGYNVATQANGTLDDEWSTCVGCAVLSRSLDRTGTTVPEACTKCFQRYCWNGTASNQTTTKSSSTSGSSSVQGSLGAALWSAVLMMGMAVLVTA